MIEKITKILPVANIIALVVVALILVGNQSASLGAAGDINTQTVWFVKGLTAGNPKVSAIDSSGNVVAPVTSSTGTFSSTLGITGRLSANAIANTFGTVASSTVQVGAASKSGCLILGDSANGASVVYITATGSTVTASTTKPAACQTVL